MKLISYTNKANKPLLDMLNAVCMEQGFAFAPEGDSDRPDIAAWQKPLGPTLRAEMSITLSSAVAPNTWSLEPIVMIDSAYAAEWYNRLRLYRDFYPVASDFRDEAFLQVLRFFPAHIRWQERLDLQFPTLKGRIETIGDLKDEFINVCEHYVAPVLAQLGNPLAVAEFQLLAQTGLRSTRLKREEPRYSVSNPTISTALLFDEAGETARAVGYLEQTRDELSHRWAGRDPAMTAPAFGQLDRLLEHLRNKLG
jgi:hypothetical protein